MAFRIKRRESVQSNIRKKYITFRIICRESVVQSHKKKYTLHSDLNARKLLFKMINRK